MSHIKGLPTDRCQSYHFHNGHRETSRCLTQKLEKIYFKIDNPALKADKRKELEDEVDAIKAHLKAFEQQLIQLRATKIQRTTHQ